MLATATEQEIAACVLKCREIAATPSKLKALIAAGAESAPKRTRAASAQKIAQLKKLVEED